MKPAYLYAKVSEDNHITLKWKWYGSSYDVAGFKIERRRVDVIDFTTIGTTADYVFKDMEIDIEKKSSYIYRVHAFKGTVISGYSNEVRIDLQKKEIEEVVVNTGTEIESGDKPTKPPESTAVPGIQTPKPAASPITKTKPGTVWLIPDELQVQTGTYFTTSIHVNTGTQRLAAYGIIIEYSDALLSVNRDIGKDGVIAGSDGFVAAVNARDPGVLFISGMNARGMGPLEDLHLVSIQWKALSDGASRLSMTIRDMTDEKTTVIKNVTTIGGVVSIIPKERNEDSVIVYNDARWTEESGDTPEENMSGNTFQRDNFNDNRDNRDNNEYEDDYSDEYNDEYSDEYNQEYDDEYDDTDPDNPPSSSTAAPRRTARPTVDSGDPETPTAIPTRAPRATAIPDVTSTPTPEPVITPTATPERTQSPTAPPGPPGTGNIWFEPSTPKIVNAGSKFSMAIHVNSGRQRLSAYGLRIMYSTNIITIDKNSGSNGASPGSDGFIAAVNSSKAGEIFIAGFDASGKGPGSDLHLLNIHFEAVNPGTSSLRIIVDSLVDSDANTVGNPSPKNGTVRVQ